MLNFLNTAVLAVAAAALFPFLLHLFSRRKVKVVPFSSITFLKAMQKRQVRAIKIKQLLLLIIRTLIILAVVLAFARPATRGGYLGSHATVSAVIIVDNSASMARSVKDGRLLDLAIRKARGIINQLEQSDEAAVITTSGEFSRLEGDNVFGNPAAALEFLNEIEMSDRRAELTGSYSRAVDLLSKRLNLNREIYIISDFQDNSFNLDQAPSEYDGKTFLADLPANDVDNSTILNVDLGNQLIEVGIEIAVAATVKKQSGAGDEEMLVSLYLDDLRLAQAGLRLQPGENGTVSFPMVVNNPGFHSGSVTLSDDDLLSDNTFYFSFYIPDQFNIMLAGEEGLNSRLFKLALAPDESLRRHWSVHQVSYRTFSSANLNQYDVLILANYSSLSGGDVARIKEFVKKGGGLLINLGQKTDSAHYNKNFVDLTGITLTSQFPDRISRAGHYLLTDFDLEHLILSVFAGGEDEPELSFRSYARIKSEITGGDEISLLARYSDGSPALTTSQFGRGRVMYFGCDIAPDISDISLHPFFVPFVVRSCEYLSSNFSSHAEDILAGSSPTRSLRKSFNVKNEYVLVMPDGQRRMLAGQLSDDIRAVECGRLDRSGLYTIMNGMVESDRFAVNIDPSEGDLYRTDWGQLLARFANAEKIPYAADLAGFITEKRFGRELWHFFLIAALLLLALEMFIARDRGAPLPSEE
jgi:hypothetical protein